MRKGLLVAYYTLVANVALHRFSLVRFLKRERIFSKGSLPTFVSAPPQLVVLYQKWGRSLPTTEENTRD